MASISRTDGSTTFEILLVEAKEQVRVALLVVFRALLLSSTRIQTKEMTEEELQALIDEEEEASDRDDPLPASSRLAV